MEWLEARSGQGVMAGEEGRGDRKQVMLDIISKKKSHRNGNHLTMLKRTSICLPF
jgi:hypothetical protein